MSVHLSSKHKATVTYKDCCDATNDGGNNAKG